MKLPGCVCFVLLSLINLLFTLPWTALLTADGFVHRLLLTGSHVFKYIGDNACVDIRRCLVCAHAAVRLTLFGITR